MVWYNQAAAAPFPIPNVTQRGPRIRLKHAEGS